MHQQSGASSWASSKIMGMMKNMGWEHGKGLGREGQGIIEPVKVNLRPGRGAIGAYGAEKTSLKFGEKGARKSKGEKKSEKKVEKSVDKKGKEVKFVREVGIAWKKLNADDAKPTFKTLNEVINERVEIEIDDGIFLQTKNVKFIDMTGPEQKVYDNMDAFRQRAPAMKSDHTVCALISNLDQLIVDCIDEFQTNNDRLRALQKKTQTCEDNKILLEHDLRNQESCLQNEMEVLELIKRFNKAPLQNLDTLDEYHALFRQLKKRYPQEFDKFNLDCLMDLRVLPLIKQLLSTWTLFDPTTSEIRDFHHEFHAVLEWADLLGFEFITQLLVNEFFNKWYTSLCQWLSYPNAVEAVTRHYRDFRSKMPPELMEKEPIKAEFIRALMAIKQAQQGLAITPMKNYEQAKQDIKNRY